MRRFFTLLEVLIALALTMILLTTLLGAYFQAEKTSLFWRQQEEALFPERYLNHRLEEVFRGIDTVDQKKTFFFTSADTSGLSLPGSSSLVFSYQNGVVLNIPLSGSVLGRLYVDRDGNLTLLTWPSPADWPTDRPPPVHREVLMSQLRGFQVEFFHIPTDKQGETQVGWKRDVWSKDYKYAPGLIKMRLTKANGQTSLFCFPIPAVVCRIQASS